MVFVALDHAAHAGDVVVGEIIAIGNARGARVAVAVRFDVGFVDNVHAEAVGEFVPVKVVGIMAGGGGGGVVLFHQEHVLLHALMRNELPRVGIELVAVHA